MRRRRLTRPRLISLAISPYNEFGRWSLDACGIAYSERRQALVLHVFASRLAGGNGTTPTLVTTEGTIGESAEIAEWADARATEERKIYPTDAAGRARARDLVRRFTTELGVARRIPWEHVVDDLDMACRYWGQGIPSWQARVQPWALRLTKPLIRRDIGLRREQLAEAPAKVEAIFDQVAEMLDGSSYLLGEHPSVADICFAAMASPAVAPTDGYPGRYLDPGELPAEIAERIRTLREHPAGGHALRMYREHRYAG